MATPKQRQEAREREIQKAVDNGLGQKTKEELHFLNNMSINDTPIKAKNRK